MTGRGAQRAFGGLLARPLVTAASDPELYRAVARHLAEVRAAARTLGYRLASSGQAFRLVRVPVAGAVTAPPPPPDRPGRRVLALTCVLAAACAEVTGPASLARLSGRVRDLTTGAVATVSPYDPELLAHRRRRGKAEAALIAVDPKTGDILALVGGRSYNQSQYNRAISSRRQPGSVFKPFVYLTAFEEAAEHGRNDITPATIVNDEPETFEFDDQVWTPENYEKTYDGPITYRHALAHSRNLATIHVAQAAGYDRVAAFWKKLGVGAAPKPYPSIALGVFEATPYEIAPSTAAYLETLGETTGTVGTAPTTSASRRASRGGTSPQPGGRP